MDLNKFNSDTKKLKDFIEDGLEEYIPNNKDDNEEVLNAVRYSLLSGGKRIRPILTLKFCEMCGKDIKIALPFACAVEMIHSYSLIHDDLPCMDNDDLRRGKPSTHVKYGEDIALLAGDALLNLAFETMLNESNLKFINESNALKCARIMAHASGVLGMIGGQAIDLKLEKKNASLNEITDMYNKKTGAIISAACEMGCIVAGADNKKVDAAKKYANAIGLAFQIVDDILDFTSNEETLGKPVKSDMKNQKSTYVSIAGIEKSRILVNELTQLAIESLNVFDNDTSFLINLAELLKTRNK